MEVSFSVDLSGAERRFGAEAAKRAQRALIEAVATDCREEPPKLTGALQESLTKQEDRIAWTVEYAERVYHRSSKPFWCERAKEKHADEWRQVCKEALS